MPSDWSLNAARRHEQIVSGRDLSYDLVLWPTIRRLLGPARHRNLVDAGCGSGVMSARLAGLGWNVTGIDRSLEMIRTARREFGDVPRLDFQESTIEEAPECLPTGTYHVVLFNMATVEMRHLQPAFEAARTLLRPKGVMVLTTVHPWFWDSYKNPQQPIPQYWNRDPIPEPFTISLDPVPLPSPIVRVPHTLEDYVASMKAASFVVTDLLEPRPAGESASRYPIEWSYPRFIAFRCRASGAAKGI